MRNNYIKAFTLIEILFVISILGILLAIALPNLNSLRSNQILNSTTVDVVSAINKASSQTLASLDSSSYGVHFASDRVVIYKGTVYDVNDLDNQVVEIDPPATISVIGLGGYTSIYFERLTGAPSIHGTVTIGLTSGVHMERTIIIDATGRVSSN